MRTGYQKRKALSGGKMSYVQQEKGPRFNFQSLAGLAPLRPFDDDGFVAGFATAALVF